MKNLAAQQWLKSFLLLLLIPFVNGCAFYELRKEVAEFEQTYGLGGKVDNLSSRDGQVIIVLFTIKDGKKVLYDYSIPEKLGHYSFLLPKGTYYVGAFEDLNNNFTYDPGEYADYYGAPDQIALPAKTTKKTASNGRGGLDFTLSRQNGMAHDIPVAVDSALLRKKSLFKLGVVTDLDNPIFSQANGTLGYWRPLTFSKNFGVGIYFLEPYDPDKIPVLFVHGATGTPAGWKTIVANLDRNRFQPWFYYYPSGMRLNIVGRALDISVKELHRLYQFERLYLFAHSMGGLVARSFIMKNVYEEENEYTKLFVSVSTPWKGHPATKKGVKNAPEPVPSWYDMVPDSEFIQSIFKSKIPQEIPYFLFFTVRGNCSLFMANNDGSVEISSQLDMRAQRDAERLFGYDEGHDTILTNKTFLEQFNQILATGGKQLQK